MIRILRGEGIRRAELLGMVMSTLPADITENPVPPRPLEERPGSR